MNGQEFSLNNATRQAEEVHVQSCQEGWTKCDCSLAKAIRVLEKSIIQGIGRIDMITHKVITEPCGVCGAWHGEPFHGEVPEPIAG